MSEHIVDYLLSDEFVTYSQKIAEIHAAKKTKTEELKSIYATMRKQIDGFDLQAIAVNSEWENWKTQKVQKEDPKDKNVKA
jgi:regulator of sigma D